MSPDRHAAIKFVFSQALDLPESERPAFVHKALDDTTERAEVHQLLRWYAPEFLEQPALREEGPADSFADDRTPELFTPYTIVRELGHGGMGTVYLATREDQLAGHQVALKVISASGDPKDLEDRLRTEMRALVRLKHLSIVSVLHAGISSRGRVFLVMEYVDGLALDAFCRHGERSIAERLRLFLPICDAVSHAHRALIIHRDLKPSNILVTHDGQPKLVDFGLAKILGDDSPEALTTEGRWRISLRYASPEQIRGTDLTTATDVYSLGVILYELLTGVSPYGRDTDPVKLIRAVLEKEAIRPQDILHGFDRDLSAILLKALRKEPQARHTSVDELRHDIDCYLRGRPVPARDWNVWYVLSKFMRRHVTALVLTVAIVTLMAVAAANWFEARRSRIDLNLALKAASDISRSYEITFQPDGVSVQADSAESAGMALVSALRREHIDLPTHIEILNRLVNFGELLGHPTNSVTLGNVAAAVRLLREAMVEAQKLRSAYPADSGALQIASRSNRSLGGLLIEENDYAGAARLFQTSIGIDNERVKHWPRSGEALSDYADSLANLSRIAFQQRDEVECLRLGKESISFRREATLVSPNSLGILKDLGHGLSNYGGDLVEFGHYEEALAACGESDVLLMSAMTEPSLHRIALKIMGDNAQHMGRADDGLGRHVEAISKFADAVRRLRQLREELPLDTSSRRHLAMALSLLAEAEARAGNGTLAQAHGTEALELASESVASDPSNAKDGLALEEIRNRLRPIHGVH